MRPAWESSSTDLSDVRFQRNAPAPHRATTPLLELVVHRERDARGDEADIRQLTPPLRDVGPTEAAAKEPHGQKIGMPWGGRGLGRELDRALLRFTPARQ